MSNYTFDELDLMSIDELERIIDEDVQKPLKEQMDEDTLLYILHLIDNSGAYKGEFLDVEKARETFYKFYSTENTEKPKRFKKTIKRSKVFRAACAAIILVVFFCSGVFTAEAARAGYLKSKIRWGDEYFAFEGVEGRKEGIYVAGDFETLPILQPFQQVLIQNNHIEDVMVTYLPSGYNIFEYTVSEGFQKVEVKITLFKLYHPGEDIILWFNDPGIYRGYEYPKDTGKPEEYLTNDIVHYIMTNDGKWQALWKNGDIECCISGVESKELLIKIIDSIYIRP